MGGESKQESGLCVGVRVSAGGIEATKTLSSTWSRARWWSGSSESNRSERIE
jgi:hypothetical protein